MLPAKEDTSINTSIFDAIINGLFQLVPNNKVQLPQDYHHKSSGLIRRTPIPNSIPNHHSQCHPPRAHTQPYTDPTRHIHILPSSKYIGNIRSNINDMNPIDIDVLRDFNRVVQGAASLSHGLGPDRCTRYTAQYIMAKSHVSTMRSIIRCILDYTMLVEIFHNHNNNNLKQDAGNHINNDNDGDQFPPFILGASQRRFLLEQWANSFFNGHKSNYNTVMYNNNNNNNLTIKEGLSICNSDEISVETPITPHCASDNVISVNNNINSNNNNNSIHSVCTVPMSPKVPLHGDIYTNINNTITKHSTPDNFIESVNIPTRDHEHFQETTYTITNSVQSSYLICQQLLKDAFPYYHLYPNPPNLHVSVLYPRHMPHIISFFDLSFLWIPLLKHFLSSGATPKKSLLVTADTVKCRNVEQVTHSTAKGTGALYINDPDSFLAHITALCSILLLNTRCIDVSSHENVGLGPVPYIPSTNSVSNADNCYSILQIILSKPLEEIQHPMDRLRGNTTTLSILAEVLTKSMSAASVLWMKWFQFPQQEGGGEYNNNNKHKISTEKSDLDITFAYYKSDIIDAFRVMSHIYIPSADSASYSCKSSSLCTTITSRRQCLVWGTYLILRCLHAFIAFCNSYTPSWVPSRPLTRNHHQHYPPQRQQEIIDSARVVSLAVIPNVIQLLSYLTKVLPFANSTDSSNKSCSDGCVDGTRTQVASSEVKAGCSVRGESEADFMFEPHGFVQSLCAVLRSICSEFESNRWAQILLSPHVPIGGGSPIKGDKAQNITPSLKSKRLSYVDVLYELLVTTASSIFWRRGESSGSKQTEDPHKMCQYLFNIKKKITNTEKGEGITDDLITSSMMTQLFVELQYWRNKTHSFLTLLSLLSLIQTIVIDLDICRKLVCLGAIPLLLGFLRELKTESMSTESIKTRVLHGDNYSSQEKNTDFTMRIFLPTDSATRPNISTSVITSATLLTFDAIIQELSFTQAKALIVIAGILQNMARDLKCLPPLRESGTVEALLETMIMYPLGEHEGRGSVKEHGYMNNDVSLVGVCDFQVAACRVILNMHDGSVESRAELVRVLKLMITEYHLRVVV